MLTSASFSVAIAVLSFADTAAANTSSGIEAVEVSRQRVLEKQSTINQESKQPQYFQGPHASCTTPYIF
jgi:hypothetical protein